MHTRNQNTVLEGDLIPANEPNRPNGIPIEPNRSNRMLWTLSITVVLAAAVELGIILRPWTWTGPPDLIVESIRQESEPDPTPSQRTRSDPEPTPPHRTTIGTWVDRIGRWEHRIEIVATDTSIRRMSSLPNGRTQEAALTEVPPLADERRRFTDSDRRAYAISKQSLLLLFDEGRLVSELAVTGNVDRNAVETLSRPAPRRSRTARKSSGRRNTRHASPRPRPSRTPGAGRPRSLRSSLEQTTAGDLVGARETARQIQDPTRRARAIERIATAEGASPRASDRAPPPAHAETH